MPCNGHMRLHPTKFTTEPKHFPCALGPLASHYLSARHPCSSLMSELGPDASKEQLAGRGMEPGFAYFFKGQRLREKRSQVKALGLDSRDCRCRATGGVSIHEPGFL